jgi:hypothetical protein
LKFRFLPRVFSDFGGRRSSFGGVECLGTITLMRGTGK